MRTRSTVLPEQRRFGALARAALLAASLAVGLGASPALSQTVPSADVAVVVDDSPERILLDEDVTWIATVSNAGPDAAGPISVRFDASTGFAVLSTTASQGACTAWQREELGNVMTCTFGSLASGASATITVVVKGISDRYVGFISTYVTASSDTADPVTTNNTAVVSTPVDRPIISVSTEGTGSGRVTSDVTPGIDCGTTCWAEFPAHAAMTLTALAAEGSTFGGWGGGRCSGTGTCALVVDARIDVTARFDAPEQRPPGGGGGCGARGGALSLVALAVLGLRPRRESRGAATPPPPRS